MVSVLTEITTFMATNGSVEMPKGSWKWQKQLKTFGLLSDFIVGV